ncbi:gamma-glutamyltransferase [Algoriphagus sp. H41]|uniref:Glutathione hydrolase proenzyme n=1 Tax=Algoriphagus oliviformis TaxID=2811231 RepID=A0ABS3BY11_9BACT|nr:gamma-glutamyltransferase [Algoriphagus oliviformis]MBN7809749.1 gamma-glutamyltransferase [Algoriphagus oliviformis]
MKFTNYLLAFLLISIGFQNPSFSQTYGKNGMVVSDHYLASEVGVEILKKGGNAVDATVATAFALAVTHPEAGNIGGGGFIVLMKSDGEVTTFDFREKAPLGASPSMFLDENGKIKDNSNHSGLLSVGVPGTVAGLYQAHQKYGKLPWKDLVNPAIKLAKKGFPMSWGLYRAATRLAGGNESWDIMRDYFRGADGEIVAPGELWKQAALAKTLQEIRDHGRDGFYKGKVAEEIESYMKANGGIITKADLERYEAVERRPVKSTFNDFEIFSMPPPSSGGVALIEMMNLMEAADISKVEFNSTAYVHLVAEAMRRAFADRAEFLGDPDFNPEMPVDKLISKEFAKARFKTLDLTKASKSDSSRYGQLYGGDHTTHFSVVDKDGNAISMTYTLENSYGVKMGSSKLGFIFNNEMGDFNPIPGVTTSTGLIGSDPNLVAPEKRMLSSMTPTIVAKDGKPYLVIGSPGGRTIINTVFQTVLNVLVYDMRIDRAIEAMKIHHQWLPDQITYERNLLSPDTRKALEQMGHTLRPTTNLGVLMGITYDAALGVYVGAADSSSEDGAARAY